MRDTRTKFPNSIDDRLFLSDVSLSQLPVMKKYKNSLLNKNYSAASEILNNSNVFFYGAWMLNLFEDRLHAIGKAIINEEEHSLMSYTNDEPVQLSGEVHWIGD